jgi:hypothetical protein
MTMIQLLRQHGNNLYPHRTYNSRPKLGRLAFDQVDWLQHSEVSARER